MISHRLRTSRQLCLGSERRLCCRHHRIYALQHCLSRLRHLRHPWFSLHFARSHLGHLSTLEHRQRLTAQLPKMAQHISIVLVLSHLHVLNHYSHTLAVSSPRRLSGTRSELASSMRRTLAAPRRRTFPAATEGQTMERLETVLPALPPAVSKSSDGARQQATRVCNARRHLSRPTSSSLVTHASVLTFGSPPMPGGIVALCCLSRMVASRSVTPCALRLISTSGRVDDDGDDEMRKTTTKTMTMSNDKRRTTNDERRTTNEDDDDDDERRTKNDERRTTNDERRTTNDERPTTNGLHGAFALEVHRYYHAVLC